MCFLRLIIIVENGFWSNLVVLESTLIRLMAITVAEVILIGLYYELEIRENILKNLEVIYWSVLRCTAINKHKCQKKGDKKVKRTYRLETGLNNGRKGHKGKEEWEQILSKRKWSKNTISNNSYEVVDDNQHFWHNFRFDSIFQLAKMLINLLFLFPSIAKKHNQNFHSFE